MGPAAVLGKNNASSKQQSRKQAGGGANVLMDLLPLPKLPIL